MTGRIQLSVAPRPTKFRADQEAFAFAAPCLHRTTLLRWHRMATGAGHLGRYCADCGCWEQWVAQTETALAKALARPRG